MKRFDWVAIRTVYTTGDDTVTLKALSEQPGAPAYKTLRSRSSAENWQRSRAEFRDKTRTRTLEIAAIDLAEVRSRHLALGRALSSVGLTILNALRQDNFRKATAREAVQFILAGTELERKSFEMETMSLSDMDLDVDVAQLSDAELNAVIERLERYTGRGRLQTRAPKKA